jgi:membrane protease YdiL (CAAX protease family)
MPDYLSQMQIAWVFLLLFATLIPGFGEEFGWRGYMLPRLALRMSPRKAVLAHALIWWAWHLPILANTIYLSIATANVSGASAAVSATLIVLVSAIPAAMHGVIFAYIWTRTRSLAVATVYHAAYDGVRDSLQITLGHGPITQFWPMAFLTFLGLALLWKGDWRGLGRGEAK